MTTTTITTTPRELAVGTVGRSVLVWAFCLLALACDSRPDADASSRDDADAAPHEGFGLVLPSYEIQKPPAGGRTIYLQARFLSAPHGHLRDSSGDREDRSLWAEELERIEEAIAKGDVRVMSSPTLTVAAGQRAHALEANQAAYIGDFRLVETPKGELIIDPVVSVLTSGCVLDVRASVDDGADKPMILLDLLEPQLVVKLGARQCVAKLPQHGADDPLPFEEPVLLRATASKTATLSSVPIRLPSGSSLLVPLDVTVQQHTAQARAFATEIVEELHLEASPDGPRQFLLLLTARVDPVDGAAPPRDRG